MKISKLNPLRVNLTFLCNLFLETRLGPGEFICRLVFEYFHVFKHSSTKECSSDGRTDYCINKLLFKKTPLDERHKETIFPIYFRLTSSFYFFYFAQSFLTPISVEKPDHSSRKARNPLLNNVVQMTYKGQSPREPPSVPHVPFSQKTFLDVRIICARCQLKLKLKYHLILHRFKFFFAILFVRIVIFFRRLVFLGENRKTLYFFEDKSVCLSPEWLLYF